MGGTEGPFLASYTVDVNTCLVSTAAARVERVFTLSDVTDMKRSIARYLVTCPRLFLPRLLVGIKPAVPEYPFLFLTDLIDYWRLDPIEGFSKHG